MCLRTCMSSASSVLMSHDWRALVMLTKNRSLVICSVKCSALLNYSRLEKGWGLPFSLSFSLSIPHPLAAFLFPGHEAEDGRKPLRHHWARVTVSFTHHWMIIISSRLFPASCSHSLCVHPCSRWSWLTFDVRGVGGVVTCSLTGTHSNTHSYSFAINNA